MSTSDFIIAIVMSLLGGGTVGVLGVKAMNRKIDGATATKIHAEARAIATNTAKDQVEMMRTFVQDQRRNYEDKLEEYAKEHTVYEQNIDHLTARVSKLEERERHMLTRAAVHEAWDQLSFEILKTIDPNHPSPPPLTVPLEIPNKDEESK